MDPGPQNQYAWMFCELRRQQRQLRAADFGMPLTFTVIVVLGFLCLSTTTKICQVVSLGMEWVEEEEDSEAGHCKCC